jgi:hypothetical protein
MPNQARPIMYKHRIVCIDVVAQTTFIDPNQNMNVVLHPKSIVEGIGEVAVNEEHV